QPNLLHRTGEFAFLEGIHREADHLAEVKLADVRFRHARVDLHLTQILRDLEQGRGLEAGGHCLPDIHVARDHDARNGRADNAVVEVGPVTCKLRLAHCKLGTGRFQLLLDYVQGVWRNESFFDEGAVARHFVFRELEADPGSGDVRFCLPKLGLEQRRIDLHQYFSFHDRVDNLRTMPVTDAQYHST